MTRSKFHRQHLRKLGRFTETSYNVKLNKKEESMTFLQAVRCDQCLQIKEVVMAGALPSGWLKITIVSGKDTVYAFCGLKCSIKWLREKEKIEKLPKSDVAGNYCETHCQTSEDYEQSGHDPNCPHGKMFTRV